MAPPPASGKSSATGPNPAIYTVTVLLSTLLFVCIFLTASAWNTAVTRGFLKQERSVPFWIFAGVMTVVTVGLSVAFQQLQSLGITVNAQGIINSASGFVGALQPKETPKEEQELASIKAAAAASSHKAQGQGQTRLI